MINNDNENKNLIHDREINFYELMARLEKSYSAYVGFNSSSVSINTLYEKVDVEVISSNVYDKEDEIVLYLSKSEKEPSHCKIVLNTVVMRYYMSNECSSWGNIRLDHGPASSTSITLTLFYLNNENAVLYVDNEGEYSDSESITMNSVGTDDDWGDEETCEYCGSLL